MVRPVRSARTTTGLYFNGQSYYDPMFGRQLEGRGVPFAPSGSQHAGFRLPSHSGGAGSSGAGQQAAVDAGSLELASIYEFEIYGSEANPVVGLAVAAVTALIQGVLDLFGIDLFGGGGSVTLPNGYYRVAHYPAGQFIGVVPALVPVMKDSAAVEAATIVAPPLGAVSAEPPSTSGDPYGGHVTLTDWSDLFRLKDCLSGVRDSVKWEKALQACQQEFDNCDRKNDPTGTESFLCKQDLATKYGAPASQGWAVSRCACQQSKACANGASDWLKCALPF